MCRLTFSTTWHCLWSFHPRHLTAVTISPNDPRNPSIYSPLPGVCVPAITGTHAELLAIVYQYFNTRNCCSVLHASFIRAKRVSNWYTPQKKSARLPACTCQIILVLVFTYVSTTYVRTSARYQPATKIRICILSLIHIWRCRRSTLCRSRWSPSH